MADFGAPEEAPLLVPEVAVPPPNLELSGKTFPPATKPGQLCVVVVKAAGILAADKGGTSDPYAKLVAKCKGKDIKSSPAKSSVIKKTVNPEWRELFTIDGIAEADNTTLTVTLMDEDKGMMDSDDPLGQAVIALKDLVTSGQLQTNGTWHNMTLTLANVPKQSKPATGTLELHLSWAQPKDGETVAKPKSTGMFGSMASGMTGALSSAASVATSAASAAGAATGLVVEGGDGGDGGDADSPFEPEAPKKVAALWVGVFKANGIAAADSNGFSDPYAKLIVRTGEKELPSKTTAIRKKTLDPVWREVLKVDNVLDDSVQVTLVVLDDDRMATDEPLGQVDFMLRDLNDLKRDGTWVSMPAQELGPVTDRKVGKSKRPPQGTIEFKLAWVEPSEEELKKMGGGKLSKELEEYEIGEDETGGISDAPEDEGEEGEGNTEDSRIEKELKAGDYQIIAHIIEAKDLAGRDASGLSDPFVMVSSFGQKFKTATVPKTTSAVWDETLFLEGREQTSDNLTTEVVKVQVFDANTLLASELIGEFTIDLMSVYYEQHHEIYRRWVALTTQSSEDGGVTGYVKLTLAVLGPGDKPRIHAAGEEEPAESILMPPAIKLEVAFLIVKVHRAEGLPQMDWSWTGGTPKGAGIDAYAKVYFNGYKESTKVITSRTPKWEQEIWIPVLMPTVGQLLTIKVRDHDTVDFDDDVDVITIPFDKIIKKQVPKFGWWHLYGLSVAAERAAGASGASAGAAAAAGTLFKVVTGDVEGVQDAVTGVNNPVARREELRKHRAAYASTWRGKVLLTFSIFKPDEKKPLPEKKLKRPVKERPTDPPRVEYELRSAVLLGTDVDFAHGFDKDDVFKVLVEVVVEDFSFMSEPIHIANGNANFLDKPTHAPGLLKRPSGSALKPFKLSDDPSQIGDLIVYLCRVDEKKNNASERIAYARLKAADVMVHGYGFTRQWLTLQPMMAVGGQKKARPLPALLFQALLCLNSDDATPGGGAPSSIVRAPPKPTLPWPPEGGSEQALPARDMLTAYELRLHVYAARDLPATDDNGVLDAFIVAKINGTVVESTVQNDTTHPQWYETLTIRTWLPDRELAPQLVVAIWDKDYPDPDDFVGVCRLPLQRAIFNLSPTEALPDPTWLPLGTAGTAGHAAGEILMSLEILPLPVECAPGSGAVAASDPALSHAAQLADPGPKGKLPTLKAFPGQHPLCMPRDLTPESKKATIGIAVLSLCNLRPGGSKSYMGLKRPFVQVDMGTKGKGKKGGGSAFPATLRKTTPSSKPSPRDPLYMQLLEMSPMLPKKKVLLPPLNVAAYDSLFGGLRTPLIGSNVVRLEERLPETFYEAEGGAAADAGKAKTALVEIWENQRWSVVKGWEPTTKGQDDPPSFSTEHPPFDASSVASNNVPTSTRSEAEPAFEASLKEALDKMPNGWRWSTAWEVDSSERLADAEGWKYATSFTNGRSIAMFGHKGVWIWTYTRRRRWVRTRTEAEDPAAKITAIVSSQKAAKKLEKQRSRARTVTLSSVQSVRVETTSDRAMSIKAKSAKVAPARESAAGAPAVDVAVLRSGMLFKDQGDGSFEERYFVVATDGTLKYYANEADFKAKAPERRSLNVLGAHVSVVAGGTNGRTRLTIRPPGEKARMYHVEAPTADDGKQWCDALQSASRPAEASAPPPAKTSKSVSMKTPLCAADGANGSEASLMTISTEMVDLETGGGGMAAAQRFSTALAKAPGATAGGSVAFETPEPSDYGSDAEEVTEEAVIAMVEQLEAKLYSARNQQMRVQSDLQREDTQPAERAKLEKKAKEADDKVAAIEMELDDVKRENADLGMDVGDSAVVEIKPKYMKGRQKIEEELEISLPDIPFEMFTLMSGQGRKRTKVGSLKALVRVAEDGAKDGPWSAADKQLIADLKAPREFFIRLYVLTGENLKRLDEDSGSDPYLKIRLGDQKRDNRADHLDDVTDVAHINTLFEINTTMPGASLLTIECWDYDGFGRRSDDLIGTTEIDLDDRLFSESWKKLSDKPPIERRHLYTPFSSHSQGSLTLWIDIMDPARAAANPPIDIAPPPPQDFELRVVCWSVKDVPKEDRDDSGLADLFSKIKFGSNAKWESTDTHLRAQDGKASWNWRFKLPVTVDSNIKSEWLRLYVQLWDKDLLSSNDCIGEAEIPLAKWLKQTYMRRVLAAAGQGGATKGPVYWSPKFDWEGTKGEAPKLATEEKKAGFGRLSEIATGIVEQQPLLDNEDPELEASKFWFDMRNKDKPGTSRGKILLSVQLVPVDNVEQLPAGKGRAEPNKNPVLPKPVGRLQFSLNPFKMLFRLIGPAYFKKLQKVCCCVICTLLSALIIYYMFPVVLGNVVTGNVG